MIDWAPLYLSMRVATAATLLACALGISIAALLAVLRPPGRELLDALVPGPMVLPPTVLGYYLLVVLGRQSALGRVYERIAHEPIVFTTTGAVVAAAVGSLPLVMKSARVAMEEVDP